MSKHGIFRPALSKMNRVCNIKGQKRSIPLDFSEGVTHLGDAEVVGSCLGPSARIMSMAREIPCNYDS